MTHRPNNDLITDASEIYSVLDDLAQSLTIVLGGDNVCNNTITASLVIQINFSPEEIAETWEKMAESFQKKIMDALWAVINRNFKNKQNKRHNS